MSCENIITGIRDFYAGEQAIPLHIPVFAGNEKKYVDDTIASTMVSSVGAFVDRFEQDVKEFTSVAAAVAVVNGTCGLHVALDLAGVRPDDLVITQALTFVATGNAILHHYAQPVFLDVDRDTLSLSPQALQAWLDEHTRMRDDGVCIHRGTGQVVRACIPMHTFGHIGRVEEITAICRKHNIVVVEDAAEAMGSFRNDKHAGHFGDSAVLSFNGNKILTTGGGGMVLTNDEALGKHLKHVTTTAKQDHPWDYFHDEKAYNYRLPNLNAALGCAQLEMLPRYIKEKRKLAEHYRDMLQGSELEFVPEPEQCTSNYWLNAALCENREARDKILQSFHDHTILARPIWILMHRLPMFENALHDNLENAAWLEDRVVNLPSWIPHDKLA